MAFSYTSYFGLARVSDMGPEVRNWAVTSTNPEVTSLVLNALTAHRHGGATPMRYPGYNYATPSTPTNITLTETTTSNGVIDPGTTIGVRLSYTNNYGLETEGSPEQILTLSAIPLSPNAPSTSAPVSTPVGGALGGGTYVYALTKGKGSGETQVSSLSVVDVPFASDNITSYVIPVAFDALGTYGDGADSIYLYRATGLTSQFKLVKSFTDVNVTSYTDVGTVEDADHTPPTTNTFNRNKALTISWASLSHPSDATYLNVYITQQPGVYGDNNLFTSLAVADPATPLVTSTIYYGNETLTAGYPNDFSQLPNNPSKIVLGTEATGAPILTTSQDFQGYGAKNFAFSSGLATATPVEGSAYVETSTATPMFRVRLGGNYQTLVAAGATYAHATSEPGGHLAANIIYPAVGGTNVANILNVIATPVTNFRKQVTGIILATPSTASYITNSTAATPLQEMENLVQPLTPAFAGQMAKVTFNGHFLLNPKGTAQATGTVFMQINGSNSEGDFTIRSFTAPATPTHVPVHITFATPISSPLKVRMMWLTSAGELTSVAGRRQLLIEGIF